MASTSSTDTSLRRQGARLVAIRANRDSGRFALHKPQNVSCRPATSAECMHMRTDDIAIFASLRSLVHMDTGVVVFRSWIGRGAGSLTNGEVPGERLWRHPGNVTPNGPAYSEPSVSRLSSISQRLHLSRYLFNSHIFHALPTILSRIANTVPTRLQPDI